nr:NADP-dependent malic enzyme gene [Tanacetum cinerariifolium]
MTTLIIDLMLSQSGTPLLTSTATTSAVTTTTILPPPQPQQSSTNQTKLQRIDELEQHMASLLQHNLALEERLEKHGSRLYKLNNLNIPHQVSKEVNEIIIDAVDWTMQAPLQAHFNDLPTVDMKEILQQRMFESKSYEAHKDHKKLYDALEKSLKRDYSDQLLLDLDKAGQKKRKRHDLPPPHPPPYTGTSGSTQQKGNKALSLSKSAALAPYSMAWTTSDPRYESDDVSGTQELSPMESPIQDDSIPDEQIHLSDDEDSRNDHLPKSDSRKDQWKPLLEEERLTTPKPDWTIPSSNASDLQIEECHKMLTDQVDWTNLEGDQVKVDVNRTLPLGGPLDMILRRVKKKSDHTCGFSVSSELKPTQDTDFQLGIKSYQTQLNLTKPGWDVAGYKFKHDYTIIESPRIVVFSVNNNERKIMRFNEIYKFSDGTLTRILEALSYRVRNSRSGSSILIWRDLPRDNPLVRVEVLRSQLHMEGITTRMIKRFTMVDDLKESSKITKDKGTLLQDHYLSYKSGRFLKELMDSLLSTLEDLIGRSESFDMMNAKRASLIILSYDVLELKLSITMVKTMCMRPRYNGTGYTLLRYPHHNKGLAFTKRERDAHYLRGLLPPAILTQELQAMHQRVILHMGIRDYEHAYLNSKRLISIREKRSEKKTV